MSMYDSNTSECESDIMKLRDSQKPRRPFKLQRVPSSNVLWNLSCNESIYKK